MVPLAYLNSLMLEQTMGPSHGPTDARGLNMFPAD
jgi:hypothetical protein